MRSRTSRNTASSRRRYSSSVKVAVICAAVGSSVVCSWCHGSRSGSLRAALNAPPPTSRTAASSTAKSRRSAHRIMVLRELALQPGNVLCEALNRANFAGVHVSCRIHGHAFAHRPIATHARGLAGDVLGHEVPHLAGARAADAKALAPAGIVVVVGFRIDGVERVVAIDVEAADAAELIPRVEVLAVLVEDLDAAVAAIGHEQPAA